MSSSFHTEPPEISADVVRASLDSGCDASSSLPAPSDLESISCPICHRRLFSCNDAVVRLRTRLLVFEADNTYAKCHYCRNEVTVPLVIRDNASEECLPLWNETLHGDTR
jgi:hypothetical protein